MSVEKKQQLIAYNLAIGGGRQALKNRNQLLDMEFKVKKSLPR